MVVGEIAESTDLLVVGGGPGGYAAALWAAQKGREVTLVEQRPPGELGGVCLQEGCIPTKLLIEVSGHLADRDRLADLGVHGDLRFDMPTFQRRRRDVVDRLSQGVSGLLSDRTVAVRHGSFRFTRPGNGVVRTPDDQAGFLEYRDVIIATGSRPCEIPTLPFDHAFVLKSSELLALEQVPPTLLVVGGGYIGVELGTAYAKLGSQVTIIEQADELLPATDRRLVAPVRQRLRELGVTVATATTVTGASSHTVHTVGPDGTRDLAVDVVLVSAGRRPNTDELGLRSIGVESRADGRLEVAGDRRLQRHVAAIGDVTPGPALAHKATAEAQVAVDALCGVPTDFDPAAIPEVVFSDPPIATTGLTLGQATSQGHAASSARFPLTALGRAVANGRTTGFAQVVFDHTGVVLGVHLVGSAAPELIAEAGLAIEMGATVEDLALTVHPHPTLSEQLSEVAHVAAGTPLHVANRAKE